MAESTKSAPAVQPVPTAESIAAAVVSLQEETVAKERPLLTGVEVAKKIAESLPPAPPAGTKYRMAAIKEAPIGEPLTSDNSVVVTSPDGSIEDAVRRFNQDKKEIRTAKQLRIEKCAA